MPDFDETAALAETTDFVQDTPADEARARLVARRDGWLRDENGPYQLHRIVKSRRRTIDCNNHGGFKIIHMVVNSVVAGENFEMTAADVIKFFEDRMPSNLYHVTTPEVAAIILREGFKDHAAQVSCPPFGGTYTLKSGVWFADTPPIGAISVDCKDYMNHTDTDEAWIRIKIKPQDFNSFVGGNEWNVAGWPTRQWLLPASEVNKLPRDEMSLADVLAHRVATDFDRIDLHLHDDFLRELIETEMTDATIKARWLDALDAACRLRQQTGA